MNGKTQTQIEQLVELLITDIVPSDNNPRIINEKDPGFIELAESIKARGVVVPIHVRIHPEQKGKYELLAGERRARAAFKADRLIIRAINHGDISDEEAFEITFIENFAREDLTPLEQGKAVMILLTKYKNDVPAVASKMGKSIKWIRQRQTLGTKLSKDWRNAIADEDHENQLKHWTASHLQLVARLPKQMQAGTLEYYQYDGVPTLKQLDEYVANLLHLLSKAPFDIAEADCVKCQKRTSCQPGLFDDTLDPDTLKKNDRCLDRDCWDKKTLAWLKAEFEAKKKELPTLVTITTESPDYQKSMLFKEVWPDFFQHYNIQQARKKDKGTYPGFIIYGKALGTVLWIKPTGSRAQERMERPAGKPTPLKERKLMLDSKRWAQVLRILIEKIKEVGIDPIIDKYKDDTVAIVMALAGTFGTIDKHEHLYKDSTVGDWKLFQRFVDYVIEGWPDTIEKIVGKLWEQVRAVLISRLTYGGPISQTPPEYIDEAKNVSNLLGIDIEAMFKKVAEQDYPEPKSWKGLNADGTLKKAKPKKAKPKKTKSKKTKRSKKKK